MEDFEKHLSRQSFRALPPEWREEILATATASVRKKAPASTETMPWWRAWMWPSPTAWGALAAAWVLIFALNTATHRVSSDESARAPLPTPEQFAVMLAQRREELEALFKTRTVKTATPPELRSDSPGAWVEPRASSASIIV